MASRPFNAVYTLSFVLLAAAGLWSMRVEPVREGIPIGFAEIVKSQKFGNGLPLKTTYTGIKPVDGLLSTLVAAFLPGTARWHLGITFQQIHFLGNMVSPLCIWTIEACRSRNRGRLFTYTAVFALLYQVIGGAVIIPLFYAFYTQSTADDAYFRSGRQVPLHYAQAILPAVVQGFVLPTVLMYLPWQNIIMVENLTALWQPAPMAVNLFLWLFSFGFSSDDAEKPDKVGDVKWLKHLYLAAGAASAVVHLGVVFICHAHDDPSTALSFVFLPDRATRKVTPELGLHWIFQMDWIFCFGSTLLWTWIAVFDILRLKDRRVDVGKLIRAAVAIVAIAVLAGPGAALAAVWSWREDRMVELEAGSGGTKKLAQPASTRKPRKTKAA